ncbi:MAG TPA: hypothetical protein VGM56_33100 [Byssovorax sp.]|jgi:FkbM family methyltransferase
MHKYIELHQNGGTCRLKAPAEHPLEMLRRTYPLYDVFFPKLAALVARSTYGHVVDVGANIGDTIALCRLEGCEAPIVAVEPSEVYFSYLIDNLATSPDLFGDTSAIQAFAGRAGDALALVHAGGTASPVGRADGGGVTQTISLGDLDLDAIALVKVDTDGYDAAVLEASLDTLTDQLPIVWAETEVALDDVEGTRRWRGLLERLEPCYSLACAFDNFGFPVCAGPLRDVGRTISDLIDYAWRHRRASFAACGRPTLYYLDIGLFPPDSSKDFEEFVALSRR